jgi:hypothetical protein
VSKQYTAIFAIGGKLLGSFRGAMAAAQARLQALGRSARASLSGIGSILSKLSIALGAFAGYAAGKVISGMFEGAVEQAIQAEERIRSMNYTLLQNNAVRAKGLAYSKEQTALIIQNNEALAKTGVLNDDIYNEMAKGLALYNLPPKAIREAVGGMGDMLVATKGAMATEEQAAGAAKALGRAITTGQVRGLQQYGIILDKNWKKEFPTQRARMQNLMKLMEGYKGVNREAATTPLGRIRLFQNELQKTREEIGKEIIPLQAEMADAWRKILPPMKLLAVQGFKALAVFVKERLVPALTQLFDWYSKNRESVNRLATTIGILTAAFIALKLAIVAASFAAGNWKGIVIAGALAGITLLTSKWEHFQDLMQRKPTEIDPGEFTKHWYLLNQTWNETFIGLDAAIEALKSNWSSMTASLSQWWSAIWGQATADFQNFVNAVKAAWDGLVNAIQSFKPPSFNFQIPGITAPAPAGATAGQRAAAAAAAPAATTVAPVAQQFGGIHTQPTLAMLGEAGPEAVIPLSGGHRAAGLLDYANRMLGMNAGGTSVSFAPVVTINGNATESEQRAMDTRLRDLCRDFITQFKAAQYQERRLSYQGGYG